MTLNELLNRLNIKEAPEKLYALYDEMDKSDDGSTYDLKSIKALNDKYGMLGEFSEIIYSQAVEFAKHPDLILYARACAEYIKSCTTSVEARLVMIPLSDGSAALDVFPTLLLLSVMPDAVRLYRARGFSEEEIGVNLRNLRINLGVLLRRTGRPYLDQGHFNWMCHYVKAYIFDHKSFNFQPFKFGADVIYLKNKSGDFVPMMTAGRIDRDGLILGTVGHTDEAGAFDVNFYETDEEFVGNLVHNSRVDKEVTALKKSEWECVLKKGDYVVNLHIPDGTDLSPEAVGISLREGLELSKKYYPELNLDKIVCSSWLLDEKLCELLGEGAKITSFVNLFLKYPILSYGTSCLGYVFTGYQSGPVEDFPENTTLQRKIKALMLGGEYILGAGGLITYLIK